MGKGIALGIGVGAAAFVAMGKVALDSLARIERINAQTTQVIKSTGGAAGVTAKHVENLAGHLENMTGSEAEATQEGQNLLLTYTNIANGAGKGNKIFDQTTRIMVDMGRAMGTDAASQATRLGKALNDPVKGVGALSKVGVSFTDVQKKQIEGFVKSGKTMKAQKVILGELNKEFGGSAKAYAKTTAGQAALAGHALGTLQETIFAAVLPVLGKLATYVTKALTKLNEYGPQIQAVMAKAGEAFKVAGAKVQDAFKFIRDNAETFKVIGAAIAGAVAAFVVLGTAVKIYTALQIALNFAMTANPIGIIIVAIGALVGVLALLYLKNESVRTTINNMGAAIKTNLMPIIKSLGELFKATFQRIKQIVQAAVAVIKAVWARWGTQIKAVVKTAFGYIKGIISGYLKIIKGIIHTLTALIKGDWKGVWNGIKEILSGVWEQIKNVVKLALLAVKTELKIVWAGVKALTSKAWEGIKSAVKSAIGDLAAYVRGIPGQVLAALGSLKTLLFNAGKDLIQGLIDGIGSMFGAVKGKLGDLTNSLTSWKGPPKKDKVLLTPAGRMIMQSLIKGFEDGTKGVKDTLNDVTNFIQKHFAKKYKGQKKAAALAKAATSRVVKGLADEAKALLANAKLREVIYKKQAKAQKALDDLVKASADYAKNVRDAALGTASLSSLNSAFTADAMLEALQAKLAGIQNYNAILQDLIKKGLSQDLVDQLAQLGPEAGLAQATALQQASPAALAAINTTQKAIKKAADALAKTTADNMYAAGISAAQGVVNGIIKRRKQLDAEMDRLGERLAQAVQKALGGSGNDKNKKTLNNNNARTSNDTYNINITSNGRETDEELARKVARALKIIKKKGYATV